ncbi:xanthine dehydrogenase family protein molybdopterin-binding subunit [Erwinia persicina]|uniref:xanthine dehydrogenase family protein molybdopterin-binding subunit n=1 Tax=Erwinia persicina TaxID=55211 RepID=UPI00177E6EEE|nr:molybdopterin cofactor-binding domain-containing protein [Erwinia persicina]MBD8213831.1 xanthine dehydrogenase family protein molybdopterin-binding subunit [Erwinia persicina]
MNLFHLTRRRLLQAGGFIGISTLLPGSARAEATPSAVPPGNRVASFIALSVDGQVTAFNGHVDLGTGVRTSLAQYVADALDVPFSAVTMILGDTALTPDQGPTIASATLQVSARPLRQAASQLRLQLMQLAAKIMSVPVSQLRTGSGWVIDSLRPERRLAYGQLTQEKDTHLSLDTTVPLYSARRYVGTSVARVDIPAKVSGELTWIHDLRVPGMLHGRVVRPPYGGADSSAPLGNSLIAVDESSIAHLKGIVRVVVVNDFVGVVALREEQAIAAMYALKVSWKPWAGLPALGLDQLHDTLAECEKHPRVLRDDQGTDAALKKRHITVDADYVWPYQLHASIGPSCAVADIRDGQARIWSGTQNPHDLRQDIALLLGMEATAVDVKRMEASGCYGRNCADDVAADAALLSRATGQPVRVQLMREQEAAWEPKGTGQLIRVRGGLDRMMNISCYTLRTCYPSNNAPTLPLILTGKVANQPVVQSMGDRTAIPLYRFPHMRMICEDAAPLVRASWMRGVSALPNVFAHESWVDEVAWHAGRDPIDLRLDYLDDSRAITLINHLKKMAQWQSGPPHHQPQKKGDWLRGRGFAWARYIHSQFPGFGAAWAGWVCDLSVNPLTGEIRLDKIYVCHDCGEMVNPAGVRHQVHGNVIQCASRVLKEFVTFDASGTTSLEWGSYPLLRFDELPEVEIAMLDYPEEPAMGAGESTSVPGAAAIANALFDATGIRFRAPPFTPDRVLRALQGGKV